MAYFHSFQATAATPAVATSNAAVAVTATFQRRGPRAPSRIGTVASTSRFSAAVALGFRLESLVQILDQRASTRPTPKATRDAKPIQPGAIRAGRPFRQPRRIEDLELLADLPALEVRRDCESSFFASRPGRSACSVVVVARQLGQLRVARRRGLDPLLVIAMSSPQPLSRRRPSGAICLSSFSISALRFGETVPLRDFGRRSWAGAGRSTGRASASASAFFWSSATTRFMPHMSGCSGFSRSCIACSAILGRLASCSAASRRRDPSVFCGPDGGGRRRRSGVLASAIRPLEHQAAIAIAIHRFDERLDLHLDVVQSLHVGVELGRAARPT